MNRMMPCGSVSWTVFSIGTRWPDMLSALCRGEELSAASVSEHTDFNAVSLGGGVGARVVREHGHVQEREHQQHRQQDRQELALRGVSCVHEPRYGPHTPHLPSTPFPTTFSNTGLETGHLNLLTEGSGEPSLAVIGGFGLKRLASGDSSLTTC